MPLTVVLDADVLIAAPMRDTLLRAAHAGLYRARYSEEILEEVRRNLVEKRGLSIDAARRNVDRLRAFPHKELVAEYSILIPTVTNDPEDRHVLAAAIRGKADVIVTANVRHFPPAALDPYGIQAQIPDKFLTDLFGEHPDRIVQIIAEQAAALTNPPLTRDQVLANLAQMAPTFVQMVRGYFDFHQRR